MREIDPSKKQLLTQLLGEIEHAESLIQNGPKIHLIDPNNIPYSLHFLGKMSNSALGEFKFKRTSVNFFYDESNILQCSVVNHEGEGEAWDFRNNEKANEILKKFGWSNKSVGKYFIKKDNVENLIRLAHQACSHINIGLKQRIDVVEKKAVIIFRSENTMHSPSPLEGEYCYRIGFSKKSNDSYAYAEKALSDFKKNDKKLILKISSESFYQQSLEGKETFNIINEINNVLRETPGACCLPWGSEWKRAIYIKQQLGDPILLSQKSVIKLQKKMNYLLRSGKCFTVSSAFGFKKLPLEKMKYPCPHVESVNVPSTNAVLPFVSQKGVKSNALIKNLAPLLRNPTVQHRLIKTYTFNASVPDYLKPYIRDCARVWLPKNATHPTLKALLKTDYVGGNHLVRDPFSAGRNWWTSAMVINFLMGVYQFSSLRRNYPNASFLALGGDVVGMAGVNVSLHTLLTVGAGSSFATSFGFFNILLLPLALVSDVDQSFKAAWHTAKKNDLLLNTDDLSEKTQYLNTIYYGNPFGPLHGLNIRDTQGIKKLGLSGIFSLNPKTKQAALLQKYIIEYTALMGRIWYGIRGNKHLGHTDESINKNFSDAINPMSLSPQMLPLSIDFPYLSLPLIKQDNPACQLDFLAENSKVRKEAFGDKNLISISQKDLDAYFKTIEESQRFIPKLPVQVKMDFSGYIEHKVRLLIGQERLIKTLKRGERHYSVVVQVTGKGLFERLRGHHWKAFIINEVTGQKHMGYFKLKSGCLDDIDNQKVIDREVNGLLDKILADDFNQNVSSLCKEFFSLHPINDHQRLCELSRRLNGYLENANIADGAVERSSIDFFRLTFETVFSQIQVAIERRDFSKANEIALLLDKPCYDQFAMNTKRKKRINFQSYVGEVKFSYYSHLTFAVLKVLEPFNWLSLRQHMMLQYFSPMISSFALSAEKGVMSDNFLSLLNQYNPMASSSFLSGVSKAFNLLAFANKMNWLRSEVLLFKPLFEVASQAHHWQLAVRTGDNEKLKKTKDKMLLWGLCFFIESYKSIFQGFLQALASRGALPEKTIFYVIEDASSLIYTGVTSFCASKPSFLKISLFGDMGYLFSQYCNKRYKEKIRFSKIVNALHLLDSVSLEEIEKKYPFLFDAVTDASTDLSVAMGVVHQKLVERALLEGDFNNVIQLTEMKVVNDDLVLMYKEKNIPLNTLPELVLARMKALFLKKEDFSKIKAFFQEAIVYLDAQDKRIEWVLLEGRKLLAQASENIFLALFYQSRLTNVESNQTAFKKEPVRLIGFGNFFKEIGWFLGTQRMLPVKEKMLQPKPIASENILFIEQFFRVDALSELEKKFSVFGSTFQADDSTAVVDTAKKLFLALKQGRVWAEEKRQMVFDGQDNLVLLVLEEKEKICFSSTIVDKARDPLRFLLEGMLYFQAALVEKNQERYFSLLDKAAQFGFKPDLSDIVRTFFCQQLYAPASLVLRNPAYCFFKTSKENKGILFEKNYQAILSQYDLSLVQQYYIQQHILYLVLNEAQYCHYAFSQTQKIALHTLCQQFVGMTEQKEVNAGLVEAIQVLKSKTSAVSGCLDDVSAFLRKGANPNQEAGSYLYKVGPFCLAQAKHPYRLLHAILEIDAFKLRNELLRLFADYGADFSVISPLRMNLLEHFLSLETTQPRTDAELLAVHDTISLLVERGLSPDMAPQDGLYDLEAADAFNTNMIHLANAAYYRLPVLSAIWQTGRTQRSWCGYSANDIAAEKGIDLKSFKMLSTKGEVLCTLP